MSSHRPGAPRFAGFETWVSRKSGAPMDYLRFCRYISLTQAIDDKNPTSRKTRDVGHPAQGRFWGTRLQSLGRGSTGSARNVAPFQNRTIGAIGLATA